MKAVTIGSALIDIITIVDAERIERMTLMNEHKSFLWLEAGRKIPARSITTHVGGSACNAAVAFARRGWAVEAMAKLGDDLNAEQIRQHLSRDGVSLVRFVKTDAAATGVSSMIASHDRNATLFINRGANELLSADDVGDGFSGADVVHIGPLSSGSAEALPAYAKRAKADGAFVSINPGIRQLTGRAQRVFEALPHTDLISINAVEAEALVPAFAPFAPPPGPIPSDAPELMRRGLTFGGFEMCVTDFVKALRERGPRHVVITDGAHGAYLSSPDSLVWSPPAPADVQGTAGAGDAFTSTLVAALAEGVAPGEALAQASVNAAAVIGMVDTTAGLLHRDELERRAQAFLADNPERCF
jgi:sugar/nucleoside kinase (ribokinase family)